MKKFLIFLIGFAAGIFTCLFVATCAGLFFGTDKYEESLIEEQGPQITIFDEPRECISSKPFQISEVWDNGYAIAVEQTTGSYFGGQKVLFISDVENAFYDKQVINAPKGQCVKQIGICRYREEYYKDLETIPVVKLLEE